MNQGVYPLAASMINQINRLDQISNNLANLNTNGFKQEGLSETTFNEYLQRTKQENRIPTKENIITNNIPKLYKKFIDGKNGAVEVTGNSLDFSLNQPATFFKVQNSNGDIVYTRDGSFKNLDGFLVDSNGNNVLTAANEPITLEDGFENQIGVSEISYKDLDKTGNNYFKLVDGEVLDIEDNEGLINRGSLEKSNVNSVVEMVRLIDAHRSFDQSQRAVKTIDELNSKLIDKIGNNTK